MKSVVSALAASSALVGAASAATVQGFDISSYQGSVDFASAYSSGARFVIIKATEGTTYIDSGFSDHYNGATKAGFIRGGYHFAHPDSGSGADQANYFLKNGGGWTNDGITLPGMLDIEYAPSGDECYGLSASDMVSWISDFVDTYHSSTSRYPLIYSTNDWWSSCTGNSDAFSKDSPLVLARYGSSAGTIPGGWGFETIWQNADSYAYGGDSDIFNGDETQLKKIATG